jgi:signal peptidase I
MQLRVRHNVITILIVLVVSSLLLRIFVVQPYKSTVDSMVGTIIPGDYLLVSRAHLWFREPRLGDVVAFAYPEDPAKLLVERVVGLPGDRVEGRDKQLLVNGRPVTFPAEIHTERVVIPRAQNPRDNFGPLTVPADGYFVMGDNRDQAYDSRFWGVVKKDKLQGLALCKYWSWDSAQSRVRFGNIGQLVD